MGMGMKRNRITSLAWRYTVIAVSLMLPLLAWSQPNFTSVAPSNSPLKGYRTGEFVTINGTNLNNGTTCLNDSIEIKWTVPTAGSYRMPRAAVGVPPSMTAFAATGTGGNAVTFQLPPDIPCGVKTIHYMRRDGACAAVANRTSINLPVGSLDSASLIYPRDSFCVGDVNTLPTRLDSVSVTTVSGNLVVHAFNGSFFSHSGVVGTHQIQAIADQDPNFASVAWCKDTSEFRVEILGTGAPQSMAYGGGVGPYCPTNPANVFVPLSSYPGTVSGVFTSTPAGLDLDSTIGAIRTDLSASGTYQVTYTPPYAECANPVNVYVVIEPVLETRFQYLSGICAGSSGLAPAVSSYIFGNYSVTPIPPAVGTVTVNPTTGVIDATNALSGNFRVRFTPMVTGACSDTSTAIVNVIPNPVVTFTFAGNVDSVCAGTGTLAMNLTNPSSNGSFYDFSGGLVFNQAANTINLAPPGSGGSTPGGPYLVTFIDSITTGNTTCIDSFSRPITLVSSAPANVSYPVTDFCYGIVDTVYPAFTSGAVGGYYSGPAGAGSPILDPSTGRLAISATTVAGSYPIIYHYPTSAVCPTNSTTLVDTVNVIDVPIADIRFLGASGQDTLSVCANQPIVGLQQFFTQTVPPSTFTPLLTVWGGPVSSPITLTTDSVMTASLGIGGPYPIILEADVSGCKNSDTIYLRIKPFFSSAFNYVDSVACQGGSNPVPHIIGQGGGRFRNLTIPSITLDQITGEVDISNLSQVTGTNLVVEYRTSNLDSICSDTSTDFIRLIGNNSADFSYGGVRFCQSDADTLIPMFNGVALDTANFSYTPDVAGDTLVIDPFLGIIDVGASETGTYTISNQIAGGGCVAQFSLSITILPGFQPTTMNYDSLSYCAGQPNPTPVRTGDLTGIFIGTPGINLLDTLGTIDLDNSLPRPGQPYVITYRLENSDGCSVTITDSVEIRPLGGSNIEYVPNFICSTDTFFRVDTIPTVPGTFTLETESGQFLPNAIDPITGTIIIDSLGNNYQSQFEVLFTPASAACAEPDVQILQFQRGPDSASITPFPDTTFCRNQTVRILARGILDGAFFSMNGDAQIPAWGWLESQVSSQVWNDNDQIDVVLFTGEYGIIFYPDTINGGVDSSHAYADTTRMCFIRRSVTMHVVENPQLTLDANTVGVVSSDQEMIFNFTSDTDNTVVNWSVNNQNTLNPNAIFNPSGGQETSGLAGVPFPIQNTISLEHPESPAQVVYTFIPSINTSNGLTCVGTTVYDTLHVNPENLNVFIPEVFTPDGDEFNPYWMVQVKSGVDPADYTLVLYNRAGGVVYEMSPLTDTWDGGTLPDGVYWWNLLNSAGKSVDKGGLTIRRK